MPSNRKWLLLSFALFGLLAVYLFSKMTAGLIDLIGMQDPLGSVFSLSNVVGLLAGGVTFVVLFMHPKVNEFGLDVVKEIKKVTWPTLIETRAATIVVIVLVLIISAILGFFDFFFSSATNWIYH